MVDETVRGEPVSAVCQPVDTLAAVDKAPEPASLLPAIEDNEYGDQR